MEKNKLEANVKECFLEHELFLGRRDYYSSLSNLGEILDAVQDAPTSVRREWHERVIRVEVSDEAVEVVRGALAEAADYVRRILSIQGSFIYEEAVLVLTKRIEIGNILRALHFIKAKDIVFDLTAIDSDLEGGLKTHRTEFRQAQQSIKKHARLPSTSRWVVDPI
jgi:hypothetical protein